jgi:hypothetical protein
MPAEVESPIFEKTFFASSRTFLSVLILIVVFIAISILRCIYNVNTGNSSSALSAIGAVVPAFFDDGKGHVRQSGVNNLIKAATSLIEHQRAGSLLEALLQTWCGMRAHPKETLGHCHPPEQ